MELLRATRQKGQPKDYLLELLDIIGTEEVKQHYMAVKKVYMDYVDALQAEFDFVVSLLEKEREKNANEKQEREAEGGAECKAAKIHRDYRILTWRELNGEERKVFARHAESLKKMKKMLFEMKKWGFVSAEEFMGTIHYKVLEELLFQKTAKYLQY